MNLRLVWSTAQVPGQPVLLLRETLSPKKKIKEKEKKKERTFNALEIYEYTFTFLL